MPASALNHAYVLKRLAEKDQNALITLYQREAPLMTALAEHMLEDHAKAQQAVHDIFVMLWKNASHFDPSHGHARAWLYSIARYRIMREVRQVKGPMAPARIQALHQWIDEQTRLTHEDLGDGLAQAEPQAIDAAALAYYKGLTLSQISQVQEQGPDTVKAGLDALLKRLAQRWASALADAGQEELDIGHYTLGTLEGGDNQRIHQIISEDDKAMQQALQWERVLLVLADRIVPAAPDSIVLGRIQQTLGLPVRQPAPATPQAAEGLVPLRESRPADAVLQTAPALKAAPVAPSVATAATTQSNDISKNDAAQAMAKLTDSAADADSDTAEASHAPDQPARKTRLLVKTVLLVVVAAAGYAAGQLNAPVSTPDATVVKLPVAPLLPHSATVAILQPPGSTTTPGWIITQPDEGKLDLHPQLRTDLKPDQKLVLWIRPPEQAMATRVAEVHDTGPSTVNLPAGAPGGTGQIYEVTLESGSGANAQPEGPIMFIGESVQVPLKTNAVAPTVRAQ